VARRLLLADDSITIQRVIELTFSNEDVQVIVVSDGEEAIARIASDRPDIVLADIAMPKRNGYEVAAFVKGRPDLAHIPVVLLAGAFEPVDEARAQQAGSNGVLVKPFEPQHVIARVRELLGGATGNPSAQATADIPRPVARLASPKPVELPPRGKPQPIDVNEDYGQITLAPPTPKQAAKAPVAEVQLDEEDSLDDYFDRLDAAFADLDGDHAQKASRHAGTIPARKEGPVLERDLDQIDAPVPPPAAPLEPLAPDPFAGIEPPEAPASLDVSEIPTLEELLGEVGGDIELDDTFSFDSPAAPIDLPLQTPPGAPSAPMTVAPPPIEPPDTSATLAAAPVPPAAPLVTPVSAPPSATMADVFSALLAFEEGGPGAAPMPSLRPEPVVTDALVERVTERVLERIRAEAGGSLNEIVRRTVSEVAERLVREEIQRIRGRQ